MLTIIALPIVGFLIGLFIITLGGGGGAIYVGILTGFFNIPPVIAASTSLATMIPTTATGAFSHWRAGNLRLRLGLYMLGGGIIGAILGSLCSSLLPQGIYTKISGGFLILISFQMLIPLLRKKKKQPVAETEVSDIKITRSRIIKAVGYGIFGGIMSGLVGLSGGGPIIVGLSVLGCAAIEIVGTSVLVLLGISITGFLMHLSLGNIDWPLVGLLLIGTMSGALIGPMILKRINKAALERVMKPLMFVMTVGMGVLLLFK
jgi:uncharacterized membrane protein YfcA